MCICSSPLVDGFVCLFCWVLKLGRILCWEGELVCFAIFRLLCNYAREGVSKHCGLYSEGVVFLWQSSAQGEAQWCQIFPSKIFLSPEQINYTPTAGNPIKAEV